MEYGQFEFRVVEEPINFTEPFTCSQCNNKIEKFIKTSEHSRRFICEHCNIYWYVHGKDYNKYLQY